MQTIVRVGVDIAKNVLQVHAVDAQGKLVTKKKTHQRLLLWEVSVDAAASHRRYF